MSTIPLCDDCLQYRHKCVCKTQGPDEDGSGYPEPEDRPKCPCGNPALPGGWCRTCADDIAAVAADELIDNENDLRREREQERADRERSDW